MATRKSAWTEADYIQSGRVKVQLRLKADAAETLATVAEAKGISRQALIEALLANPELLASIPPASLEQPLREPSDYTDDE